MFFVNRFPDTREELSEKGCVLTGYLLPSWVNSKMSLVGFLFFLGAGVPARGMLIEGFSV